jgi:hypothetical protein
MLVTKQYLYETIASLLEGGSPSAGKKFEQRMIQAHLQQAINRKLKTEYVSVTLPSDETIPEGLVLACYDELPVGSYKGLSRVQLPAMPISLRRNMGVFFVGPAASGNLPVPVIDPVTIVTIESVIGSSVVIKGTTEVVVGLSAGSTTISSNAFLNQDVNIIRGNVPIPGIDPLDGSNFFTKVTASTLITLNTPLVAGEYLKIQTV